VTTQVPIRCGVTVKLTVDIDISQKTALNNKLTQIVTDLKTIFPDKIIDNTIVVETEFAKAEWKV